MIEKLYNLLNDDELIYINNLIEDKNIWQYNTIYSNNGQYFDSITIDKDKLENYYNIITENGKYKINETGLNVISKDRQLLNSIHKDNSDVSYVTYLNENFDGGDLIYYNKKEMNKIIPQIGLSIKIHKNTLHKVDLVFILF